MKDEIGKYIEIISTYDELEKEIDNYMYYYNNERYQYNLAKLSPNEYLEYYKTGNYPLKHIIEEPIDLILKHINKLSNGLFEMRYFNDDTC